VKILKTSGYRALNLPDDPPGGKQYFELFEASTLKPAHAKFAVLAILSSSIVLLVALLLIPPPKAPSSALGMALHDMLHFPLFALLTWLIYASLRRLRQGTRGRDLALATAIACVLGGVSELAQTGFGRTASWRDLQLDLVGTAVAAATVFVSWRRGAATFRRWLVALAAFGVAAALVVAYPAWLAAGAEGRLDRAFPRLGDFEAGWESLLWQPQGETGGWAVKASRSTQNPSLGKYALRVDSLDGAAWAGVRLLVGKRRSWAGSYALHFDVFNPADTFELGVRIDGFDGERFSASVSIVPGANRCHLPLSALKNSAGSIADLDAFAAQAIILHLGEYPRTRTFYIDNVRLE